MRFNCRYTLLVNISLFSAEPATRAPSKKSTERNDEREREKGGKKQKKEKEKRERGKNKDREREIKTERLKETN